MPFWVRSSFARQIVGVDQLSAFGLADRDGSVRIDFQSPDGASRHVRLTPSAPLKAARTWVGYQLYAADSTAMFWLERRDPNDEFFSMLSAFLREVRQQDPRKIVIDLHGNPGGDSSVAVAILRSLGQTLRRGPGSRVFAMVFPTAQSTPPRNAPKAWI